MLRRLFCYGTLQDEAVVAALLGSVPTARGAVLPGYRRVALPGRPWPGVIPVRRAVTPGTLYDDLSPADLTRLDRYEGTEYRRAVVRVLASGRPRRSWIYLPKLTPPHAAAPWHGA